MNISWKVEKRKLKDLLPYPGNPRRITREAMNKLKERIETRGFHDVLKIDTDGTILSGNQRHQALTELGVEMVEVKVPDRKLTKEERQAVLLESNSTEGTWDNELLGQFEQETLLEVFNSSEVDSILKENEDEEDDFDGEVVAENIKTPTSKIGDLFKLGPHTLLCGDSTKPDDLYKLMGGGESGYGLQRSAI